MLVDLFPERRLSLRFDSAPPPAGYMQSQVSRGSLDTGKLRGLGWRPSTTLAEGFKRTVRSFEEQR
jgi:nucleoside-diphosphate-sugar epimerase